MWFKTILFLLLKIANKKFKIYNVSFFLFIIYSQFKMIKDSVGDYYTICDNLGHS